MNLISQEKEQPLPIMKDYPYDRKEEIINDGKRYRVHNNYLSLGGGFLSSSIRNQSQKVLGIDFQFHVRKQHFQLGSIMSGQEFRANNNVQGHIGYGYRKETKKYNLAAFAGPNYYTGVVAVSDTGGIRASLYEGFGAYFCLQGVAKLMYDFGVGVEIFGDFSKHQNIFGFKLIGYFSGAYRGPKKNYNPHVRAENPR